MQDPLQNESKEEEQLQFLPADHQLLQRYQVALTKQLTDEHEKVDLELNEKEENLKKIEKEKEEYGVSLYGVQQQLAQIQMTFEQANENHAIVKNLRLETEQKVKALAGSHQQKSGETEELVKKIQKAQDELKKLNLTLKEVDSINSEMKGEIEVTRTTVLRAEKNVINLEKDKKKQDFLIDMLNEEIKRLNEQKATLIAQLIAQKEETEQARQVLKEAQMEMQKILASKKNLLERWQKAIFYMQMRDNIEQQEVNDQLATEAAGIDNEIKKEQEKSDDLVGNTNMLIKKSEFLVVDRTKLSHKKEKLEAQIQLLTKSLASTEFEGEQKSLEDQMSQIENNIMKINTETKKLDAVIRTARSEHQTLEKTAANLYKQAHEIELDVEEKESVVESLKNEIARVQIDKLNTTAEIEMLEVKRNEVLQEKLKKEEEIDKSKGDIKQGHDLNEKKQHEVAKLNKILGDLKASQSEINLDPREAKKRRVERKIAERTQEIEAMQREWLSKQTELVERSAVFEKLNEKINKLNTKNNILEHKKIMLNANYKSHEKEIKEIKNNIKNLQNDMNKLNDFLADRLGKEMKLKNENSNVENEFSEKLKEMEKEAVKLEVETDKLKEQKIDLLSEIVECERQILLWERKSQLEKEMQDNLNPNCGQKEIEEFKKDIHRMELKLDDIRKKQENIILEMERAVYKKDAIKFQYMNKDAKSSAKGKTQIMLIATVPKIKKEMTKLKTTMNQSMVKSQQLERGIKQQQNQILALNEQIQQESIAYDEYEKKLYEENQKIVKGKMDKLINIYLISQKQILANKFDELVKKSAKLSFPEQQLIKKYNDMKGANTQILESLEKIANDFPQHGPLVVNILERLEKK